METKWPHVKRSERADLYCYEFSQLYNLVFELDKHGPALQPPSDCEPTKEDYNYCVNHLSKNMSDGHALVAKILYKSFDHT